MNCPAKSIQSSEILLDYCARTLDSSQTAELEKHLAECADCSRFVDAQRDVWLALEQWTPQPVSPGFDARLYARIAGEQAAPAWRTWLRRLLQPPIPYALWKPAVPLAAACAVLAAGFFMHAPAPVDGTTKLHAEKVDIEQVEKTLEDFDLLTPASQAPAGSM